MLPDRGYRTFGALATLLWLAGCASDDPPAVAEATPEPAAEAAPGPAAPAPAPTASTMAQAERDGEGLGLSQAELVQVFAANGLDPDAFEMQDLGEGRRVLTASYPATTERQVLFVALFGEASDPHTIRVDYFPMNAREEEAPRVGATLDSLMLALFPDWGDAGQWPEVAGQRAWQETTRMAEEAREQGAESVQVPIIETDREGVSLSAVSLPPSVLSYVLTTRESCRPANPASRYSAGFVGCV